MSFSLEMKGVLVRAKMQYYVLLSLSGCFKESLFSSCAMVVDAGFNFANGRCHGIVVEKLRVSAFNVFPSSPPQFIFIMQKSLFCECALEVVVMHEQRNLHEQLQYFVSHAYLLLLLLLSDKKNFFISLRKRGREISLHECMCMSARNFLLLLLVEIYSFFFALHSYYLCEKVCFCFSCLLLQIFNFYDFCSDFI